MKRALTMGLSAAVLLAFLVSMGLDFVNTTRSGATDLRGRIVGVRLLEHGLDPYTYKWHEGAPPEYCIASDNPNSPVSGVTVTPALLMLHAPLALLPYGYARFLFLALQWLLLAGTCCLWLRASATSWQRWFIVLFATGFTYTVAWRLHSERGQAYLLLTFVFACWLTATLNPKWNNNFVAGCLAGFLAALRPTYLIIAPFLLMHRRNQLAGWAVGLLLGVALPLLMSPVGWSDFFGGMQIHFALYRAGIHFPHTASNFPAAIEGMPATLLAGYLPIPVHDFSGYGLLRQLGFMAVPGLLMNLAIAVPLVLWLWWTRRESAGRLLPAMAAWLLLVDLFQPAPRYSYYDVIILNVVFAGLVTTEKIPRAILPFVLGILLGWVVYYLQPGRPAWIDLPEDFFTIGAIMFLFPSPTPSKNITDPPVGHTAESELRL